MIKKLGLDVEFVNNQVSIGIEDRVIRVKDAGAVSDYQDLLTGLYPERKQEISAIIARIRKIMQYMGIQYEIKNPAFLDVKEDRDYFIKAILPWMVKYALTVPRISRLQAPVVDYLRQFTDDQRLLDIICQHFFQQTPAYFALSYITLYLDYHYPLGGTGRIVEKITAFIREHGGTISTNTEITALDPDRRLVTDSRGGVHAYQRLVWAADQKALYRAIDLEELADPKVRTAVSARRADLQDKTGNDSVLTLFLALDLDPTYFSDIATEHFFYTPSRAGESRRDPSRTAQSVASLRIG